MTLLTRTASCDRNRQFLAALVGVVAACGVGLIGAELVVAAKRVHANPDGIRTALVCDANGSRPEDRRGRHIFIGSCQANQI